MPSELLERLLALHPRELQVLRHVAFEGGSVATVAERYGVSEASAQAIVSRALRALQGLPALASTEENPAEFLSKDTQLAALKANQPALEEGLRQAALRAAATPYRRWERVLRWIAIVLIVALSGYFWLQERRRERVPQPRPVLPVPAVKPDTP